MLPQHLPSPNFHWLLHSTTTTNQTTHLNQPTNSPKPTNQLTQPTTLTPSQNLLLKPPKSPSSFGCYLRLGINLAHWCGGLGPDLRRWIRLRRFFWFSKMAVYIYIHKCYVPIICVWKIYWYLSIMTKKYQLYIYQLSKYIHSCFIH